MKRAALALTCFPHPEPMRKPSAAGFSLVRDSAVEAANNFVTTKIPIQPNTISEAR